MRSQKPVLEDSVLEEGVASAQPEARRISWRSKGIAALLAAVVSVLALAYNRHAIADLFVSDFSDVSMSGTGFMKGDSETAFTGTLQLRDDEIVRVGKALFVGSPVDTWMESDASGLLLELEVKDGLASGQAIVYADLRSDGLAEQLPPGAEGVGFLLAKWFAPRRKVASATFVDGKLQGHVKVWAPTGNGLGVYKRLDMEFAGNLPHGEALHYHDNGKLRLREGFAHGLKDGPSESFYRNGKVEVSTAYHQGEASGRVVERYLTGELRSESEAERRTDYYPTGQKKREVERRDGVPVMSAEWYSNGEPTHMPRNGVLKEYHRNGNLLSERSYLDDVEHGPFSVFYADQQRWEEGSFHLASLDGAHKKWWKNGKLALEESWERGQLHGGYQRWYDNGRVWEKATYQHGKRIGHYEKRWRNGKLAHDYDYVDGVIEGSYKLFHDNGAKWQEGTYAGGQRVGDFKTWYPDGTLRLQATYVEGRLDGEFSNWLEDGTVYEIATYAGGNKLRSSRTE